MDFGNILMVDPRCGFARCLLVLRKARIVWREDAHVFDNYLVWFSPEAVDFESAEGQHFVGAFAVVDGNEVRQQLLFGGEAVVGGHPIFCVSHLNVIIN